MDISIILSGLALLAAIVNLILLVQEKKRSRKRNAATLHLLKSLEEECSAVKDKNEEICESISAYDEEFPGIRKNVQDLMQGVVPDYNEAVKAKDAVDSFSRDIATLLNFDPLEEARKARGRRRSGGEVGE